MSKSSRILTRFCLLISLLLVAVTGSFAASKSYLLYVGTYTDAGSKGIYAYRYNGKSGKLSSLGLAAETASPSFLAVAPGHEFLYAVNEVHDYKGQSSGGVGPNKERQEKAHAHGIEPSARNRFAYVADLGLDRVLIYRFDASKGMLSRGDASGAAGAKDFFSATLSPGSGPRHIAFSADGNFMYALGELDSTVTVFANDAKETYRSIQKISALPAGFSGKNDAAEIAMHPSGKFLYTSNRGDDSIAVFAVDQSTGKLTFLERAPSGGKTPRNFAIDPTGRRLLVANQESGNVIEFGIDQKTGKLTTAGEVAKGASPVCLVFVPVD